MPTQKGSSATATIIIIALLIIGGSYYVYKTKENTGPAKSSELLTYTDSGISFQYPPVLSVKVEEGNVRLSHSISNRHADPCDFKGDAVAKEQLTDFHVSFLLINESLEKYVKGNSWPDWDYVSQNPYTYRSWSGYKIASGVEGCGEDIYFLAIAPDKTLRIDRAWVTEFKPIIGNNEEFLSLPGIITPAQAEEYFESILASLKVE